MNKKGAEFVLKLAGATMIVAALVALLYTIKESVEKNRMYSQEEEMAWDDIHKPHLQNGDFIEFWNGSLMRFREQRGSTIFFQDEDSNGISFDANAHELLLWKKRIIRKGDANYPEIERRFNAHVQ